jgi:hypothetical protein
MLGSIVLYAGKMKHYNIYTPVTIYCSDKYIYVYHPCIKHIDADHVIDCMMMNNLLEHTNHSFCLTKLSCEQHDYLTVYDSLIEIPDSYDEFDITHEFLFFAREKASSLGKSDNVKKFTSSMNRKSENVYDKLEI